MFYPQCKIYNDGGHFIALPHTTRPGLRKRPKPTEDLIAVAEKLDDKTDVTNAENNEIEDNKPVNKSINDIKRVRLLTKKELFDELYEDCKDKRKREKISFIVSRMVQYFKSEKETRTFVEINLERKQRNLICRKVRLYRKARLQSWNFFCTFTYDNAKHTEESFRKKLADTFKKMCYRRGWKYIGVWERSAEKERLHFHGLFYVPDGQMVGELFEVKDYSQKRGKVQKTVQNTYFNERFGRSDFEAITSPHAIDDTIGYILKYIQKSDTKIVYSRNLPQFFVSDVDEDDVLCTMGQYDQKLLLFDSFKCWDEGCLVGQVSKEAIDQMPKSN